MAFRTHYRETSGSLFRYSSWSGEIYLGLVGEVTYLIRKFTLQIIDSEQGVVNTKFSHSVYHSNIKWYTAIVYGTEIKKK